MTAQAPSRQRLLTIGTVCGRLKTEFPDISISKIRYLEDQGLLNPRRTQGGYRLFSEEDVERLETILRLQRDEFLPLRVIREELAAGAGRERRRRRAAVGAEEQELDVDALCERAGIAPERARELEEFGLLEPRFEGRARLYTETDVDVAAACETLARYGIAPERARELEEFGLLEPRFEGRARLYTETDVDVAAACETLARYGIAPRHLRAFRSSADREAGLLEAIVAPALRSRNPERRQGGLEDLQSLAETAQELQELLLWRNVRRLAV
jgi:DNA-binding transcriptional MerR regulator